MRILLVGATGGTGLHVVGEALTRGIDVTVVARSPDKLGDLASRVRVVTGSILDAETLCQAAADCGASLSCVGSSAGFLGRGATDVYSRTAVALVEALSRAEVGRLVFCTSAGVEAPDPHEALPYSLVAKPLFLQRAYDDMTVAEGIIRSSSLDWTLVRPGRLTNGPRTGHYDVSPRFRTSGGRGVPRADVATFMLEEAAARQWVRATPTLTS